MGILAAQQSRHDLSKMYLLDIQVRLLHDHSKAVDKPPFSLGFLNLKPSDIERLSSKLKHLTMIQQSTLRIRFMHKSKFDAFTSIGY